MRKQKIIFLRLMLIALITIQYFSSAKAIDISSAFEVGYLPVSPKDNLFYVLTHASIDNAPLIIYLNGGPGASSMVGAFVENGPLLIENPFQHDLNFRFSPNPWAWSQVANIVYLDQPRYVGFSDDVGLYVTSFPQAGKDFLYWLKIFYERYPEFINRPLYLAGESYAGAYIAEYTHQILENNKAQSIDKIPLAGLFIMSGVIGNHEESDVSPYYQLYYLCHQNMLPVKTCAISNKNNLRGTLDQCVKYIARNKHILMDEVKISDVSQAAQLYQDCQNYLHQVSINYQLKDFKLPDSETFPKDLRGKIVSEPVNSMEFFSDAEIRKFLGYSPNPYHMKLSCQHSNYFPPWCYDGFKLDHLFNNSAFRQWLGKGIIPTHIEWQFASFPVNIAFEATQQKPRLAAYFTQALNASVKIFFIYGKDDWIMNYFVEQKIVNNISIAAYHLPLFLQLPASPKMLHPLVDQAGNHVGEYQNLQNLTFVQIDQAGHMVSFDQPEVAYEVLQKFLEPSWL